MNSGLAIFVAILLLLANAFFVASEFAVTSSRREQLEAIEDTERYGVKAALYASENVSLMLAVCQLGITLASVGLGAVAEPAVAKMIERPLFLAFTAPPLVIHSIAFLIALAIVVFLHIIVGEMVPKNLSLATPVKVLLLLAPALTKLASFTRGAVNGMNYFANTIVRLFGVEPKDHVGEALTADEVASILEKSTLEGTLSDEVGLLSESLQFASKPIANVMVPREKVKSLAWPFTVSDFEEAVAKTGYSRFLITDEQQEYLGYLHTKDLLYADTIEKREQEIEAWRIRDLLRVPLAEDIEAALTIMQKHGVHIAGVEKDGRVQGIIFLEDILEELVGQVRDSLQRKRF